ncbi:MAG: formylglycine-generating enzyme family protein [Desulfococcaceae bacterium]
MKRIFFWTAVFIVSFAMAAFAGENPCRQRLLSICDENQSGAICRLLQQDVPETRETVTAFLREIGRFDDELQQDLICARLMGTKEIRDIQTELVATADSNGRYAFKDGMATWRFDVPDPGYEKWVTVHEQVDRMKLCTGKGIVFQLRGLVSDFDVKRSDGNLAGFTADLENVELIQIDTLYGEGPFSEQVKPLTKMVNAAYDRLMDVGLESGGGGADEGLMSRPAGKRETFTNRLGMEFVKIPAGEFVMGGCGQNDERPLRRVRISRPFFMGRYEVTQAQWQKVMGNNPSRFDGCADCPVEQVSWEDVQGFLKKLNDRGDGAYRLPSEAEWEYAARAGSTSAYSFGDDEGQLGVYAWYDGNAGGKTHPVGKKRPNAWGLHDMHGNVWEWCRDWYGAYAGAFVTDPTGPPSGTARVLRGGGWNDYASYCRAALRNNASPDFRNSVLGFRLVGRRAQ